ncbi:MAG: ABC transporter substrate-binding protein [bacterium]
MKSNKTILLVAVAVVLLVGGWLWYSKVETDKAEKAAAAVKAAELKEASVPIQTVKVAFQADELITASLLGLAEDKGIFTKNRIEIKKVTSASAISTLLKSGEADVSITSAATVLLGYLNKQDTQWIDKIADYPALFGFVGKAGDISTFKNAGVSKLGTSPQIYTEVVAPNLGIKGKIDFVVAANGAPQLAMIDQGKLDFIVSNVYNDTLQKIISEKKYQSKSSKDTFKNKKVPVGVFTNQKQIDTNSDALARFVKSINEVSDYVLTHKNEFKEEIKKDDSVNDALAQQIVDAFISARSKTNKPVVSDLNDLMPVLKGLEPAEPGRDLNKFVNTKYVK